MDFISAAYDWDKLKSKYNSLPFFLIWEIWLARNNLIFEGHPFLIHRVYLAIKGWMDDRVQHTPLILDGSRRIRPHEISLPALFFDGASADGVTSCGVWIKLPNMD